MTNFGWLFGHEYLQSENGATGLWSTLKQPFHPSVPMSGKGTHWRIALLSSAWHGAPHFVTHSTQACNAPLEVHIELKVAGQAKSRTLSSHES